MEKAVFAAAQQTMEVLLGDVVSAQVMPFDTGDMQNNQTYTNTARENGQVHGRLITDAPQARRLYYHPEYAFQTVNNPNAGAYWLEPWISGGKKDFLRDTYAELYRKEAGL